MSDARRKAEEALAAYDARYAPPHVGTTLVLADRLADAVRALLAAQDGAGAKQDDCLCRCPETPGTHTATRCWDPAPTPASDEPWTWERVARRVGEEFSLGKEDYYKLGPAEWQDWMLARIYAACGAPSPASDDVREAAERLREALREARKTLAAINYTPVDVVIERIDAALDATAKSVRERLGRDKTVPGHPGDAELLR